MKSPKKASTTKTTKSSKTGTDKAKAKTTPTKDSIAPKTRIIDDEDDDLDMDLGVDEFDADFDDDFDDDDF